MFFVFYFIKISKFALPGVMLMYERTSKDRKERTRKKVGTSNKTDSDWAVGRFALLLRDWTSVSREWFLRQLSRCVDLNFHTCWMTRFYNYASD